MTLESLELPYQWHGRGAPLVLISGLGGKGTSWQPFLDEAAHHYRVLTFDNPGAGRAPALAGPIDIRTLARCVRVLLDRLGLAQAHVMGRSMGGMIAQELALLAPERIRKLVLVSTSGRVDPHLAQVFRLWACMAEQGVPLEIRHRSSLLWCLGSQALKSNARVQAYLRAKSLHDRPTDYALQAHACESHDALSRLPRVSAPTLIVSGTDDRLMPGRHAELLAKAIPASRLCFLPQAGHLPYVECPERFSHSVLQFLNEGNDHE